LSDPSKKEAGDPGGLDESSQTKRSCTLSSPASTVVASQQSNWRVGYWYCIDIRRVLTLEENSGLVIAHAIGVDDDGLGGPKPRSVSGIRHLRVGFDSPLNKVPHGNVL